MLCYIVSSIQMFDLMVFLLLYGTSVVSSFPFTLLYISDVNLSILCFSYYSSNKNNICSKLYKEDFRKTQGISEISFRNEILLL